jgi:hypothetical protein
MFVSFDLGKRDQASSNDWTDWFRIWLMAPNVIWDFKFLSCLSAKKGAPKVCSTVLFVCVTLRAWMRVPARWDCALAVLRGGSYIIPKNKVGSFVLDFKTNTLLL